MQVSLDNAAGPRSGRTRHGRLLALAVLGCALVAAAWWWRQELPHGAMPLSAMPVDVEAAAPLVDEAGVVDVAEAWDEAVAPAVGAVRRPLLRHAFETAEDLFAYSQDLLPAVNAGDAEATWLLARVVDYCAGHASDPAAFARDSAALAGLRLPAAGTLAAARGRVGARCARFSASDGLSSLRGRQLRLQAARAGSLAAEAELLSGGEPLSAAPDYPAGQLDRIGRAGDAEAFGALSSATQIPDWMALIDENVAPQYRSIIWQLAACRMGMDCGPPSTLMTAYCVNGGICSRRPEQGFEDFVYDAAVPRQSADLVEVAVQGLVERFGGRDE